MDFCGNASESSVLQETGKWEVVHVPQSCLFVLTLKLDWWIFDVWFQFSVDALAFSVPLAMEQLQPSQPSHCRGAHIEQEKREGVWNIRWQWWFLMHRERTGDWKRPMSQVFSHKWPSGKETIMLTFGNDVRLWSAVCWGGDWSSSLSDIWHLAVSPAATKSCFQGCLFKYENQRKCILKNGVLNALYSAMQSVFCKEYQKVIPRVRTADTEQMFITWKHSLSRQCSRQRRVFALTSVRQVFPLVFLAFVNVWKQRQFTHLAGILEKVKLSSHFSCFVYMLAEMAPN